MLGALSREAAVGQLKYAVELAHHASYSDAVGNRLLAAIAALSGLVGYLCHDSGMPPEAVQRLARSSGYEESGTRVVLPGEFLPAGGEELPESVARPLRPGQRRGSGNCRHYVTSGRGHVGGRVGRQGGCRVPRLSEGGPAAGG
jgi:hypothetical protein